ncbi:hypothetical protein MAHJHV54_29290 [Mycobacterium avium subsp. hominissuis]
MPCAPRISRWKMAAIGPVMGSLSLNATSMGVGLTASLAHAALLAAAAGSSGEVGTRVGMARGPAQYSSEGNGAS